MINYSRYRAPEREPVHVLQKGERSEFWSGTYFHFLRGSNYPRMLIAGICGLADTSDMIIVPHTARRCVCMRELSRVSIGNQSSLPYNVCVCECVIVIQARTMEGRKESMKKQEAGSRKRTYRDSKAAHKDIRDVLKPEIHYTK